jgi:putative membrane protein
VAEPGTGPIVASPAALLVVMTVGIAYAIGRDRWSRRTGHPMVGTAAAASFLSGLAAVGVALASPLDRAADTSLSAHMIQHVLLLSVAGPLLALGTPIPTLLWALPERLRRRALVAARRLVHVHDRRFVAWVTTALLGEALVMWVWHVPGAYEGALRNPALHGCEHASFLFVATAAWWSVATGRRSRRGAAAIAALLGSVPGSVLGLAMVLAPHPWYPSYVHRSVAAALADQQFAGVIMWALGGMAAVIAGAALFATWLASNSPDITARMPPIPVAS